MEKGEILYAGKYSAPDYELITSANCDLAIESTMINNVPEVAGKLEEIGVPVLIDQSSYETHPLGRTEWIKLYAAIVGKEDLAREIFKRQTDYLDSVASAEPTGKTAAFFYINSSGSAVARKSGDYVAKMIELAGGAYIFENLGDSETATGTVILEMENFYADAKDADFIIYNTAVDDEIYDLAELLAKNPLLADFKAVKTGGVWCVNKNLYQETTQFGLMISDFRRIFTESGLEKLNFMYKLK
jgi:iron complex transport system substrate-binding protein